MKLKKALTLSTFKCNQYYATIKSRNDIAPQVKLFKLIYSFKI